MPLEHAILSVLKHQPMSGYDLKKKIDSSIGHFWSTTQSHIYKALRKLEDEHMVAMQEIQQKNRPNRKEYSITTEGQQELERWLSTPMECDPVREAWLMQVFFAHPLGNDQIVHLFEERIHEMEKQLTTYQAHLPQNQMIDSDPESGQRKHDLWALTYDYGIAYLQFQIDWHRKALEQICQLPES